MSLTDLTSLSTAFAAVVVPLVVAWIGHLYASALRDRDRRATYIAMAIDILKQPPTEETQRLRVWATDLIDHYSEIPMPEDARTELATAQVFMDFAAHLKRLPEGARLREQERFTRQHVAVLSRDLIGEEISIPAFKRSLAEMGYFEGPINDDFTPDFAAATASFQKSAGIEPADGIFGAMTYQAMRQSRTP